MIAIGDDGDHEPDSRFQDRVALQDWLATTSRPRDISRMRLQIKDFRDQYLTHAHRAFLSQHFPAYSAVGGRGDASLLEGGEDNVNILLRDPAGTPRFVARHYLISPPSKIAGEMRLVEMLVSNRFPTPPPFPTATGEPFLAPSGEPTIALFPYVEGTVDPTWSPEQRRTAAAAIAEFHQLCRQTGFRIGIVKGRVETLRTGPDRVAELCVPGHEQLADDVAEFLTRRLEPEAASFRSLPFGPVHHDLNYGNVIWHGADVAAIIDFDECHDAPLIMDIVAAFSYLALDADHRLEFDACLAILEGYERVRCLEAEELRMLPFAWDLLNLNGGVEFLLDHAGRIESVNKCRSYAKLYLEQSGRMHEFVASLGRSR